MNEAKRKRKTASGAARDRAQRQRRIANRGRELERIAVRSYMAPGREEMAKALPDYVADLVMQVRGARRIQAARASGERPPYFEGGKFEAMFKGYGARYGRGEKARDLWQPFLSELAAAGLDADPIAAWSTKKPARTWSVNFQDEKNKRWTWKFATFQKWLKKYKK